MSKRGRPNLYEERVKPRLEDIKVCAKAGATNKEIAEMCGVGYSNFTTYVRDYQELKDALDTSRRLGVSEVKMALYRKAIGYDYEEVKKSMHKGEDGETKIHTEVTKKHQAPDSNAIGMYLRNYDPEWRDKDKISIKFKEMELELKEKAMELSNF